MTTNIAPMTYAEEQAAKAARKADRAWKKTMSEAKVYDARRVPRCTPSVAGDLIMERLMREIGSMIAEGTKALDHFAEALKSDPSRAFEWSQREFGYAGYARVGTDIVGAVEHLSTDEDEYTARSNFQIAAIIRDQLRSDILRAARSPARSSSAQSNEMERSVTAAKARLLERLERGFEFYAHGLCEPT